MPKEEEVILKVVSGLIVALQAASEANIEADKIIAVFNKAKAEGRDVSMEELDQLSADLHSAIDQLRNAP